MIDFSAIPVKLGEPKRLASLGFGAGALILGVAVQNVSLSYVLFGIGLVAMSMTLAGYLNPVTVSGTKGYYAITPGTGVFTGLDKRSQYQLHSSGTGVFDVGSGRTQNVVGEWHGAPKINREPAAAAYIPSGPAGIGIAEVVNKFQAEPTYLRYVAGTENDGKIVGQGG